MIKRRLWILLATSVVLTGCSDEAEKAQTATDELAVSKEAVVVSLNAIQQNESAMQKQFDEALVADEELANFKDGTAPLFENIATRKEEVAKVEENIEAMKGHIQDLTELDYEAIPSEEINNLTRVAQSFISSVEAFVPAYENQLQEEEKTFTSFGADDANFNTLYDGVNALNSISNDNLKILEPIIDLSVEFETQKDVLTTTLTKDKDKDN